MLNNKALAASLSAGPKTYIEDVFSTWLYTGNGSTQTITNEIDLSGKGGLVWVKARTDTSGHRLVDTARGASGRLESNSTAAAATESTGLTSFDAQGFTLGSNINWNQNTTTYASWTFRKAPKFFDVVTYTGNNLDRTIAHGLGSIPGCIIVKRVDSTSSWYVHHRSISADDTLLLNLTAAKINDPNTFDNTYPTSTVFSVGAGAATNVNGGTYVAYLFAHDAGGFGDSGNDSVVSCGSFTTDASGDATVTLGWEPQWVLIKNTSASENWKLVDTMRGFPNNGRGFDDNLLNPNLSAAEATGSRVGYPTANGFFVYEQFGSNNYIYIAIRRGPMKTPTDATKVFSAIAASGSTGTSRAIGFPSDFVWARRRDAAYAPVVIDRLRGYSATSGGSQPALETTNTGAENAFTTALLYDVWNDTAKDGALLGSTSSALWYHFRRAPGFFDVVAYTGTGVARTINHNLGVAPELIFVKNRSTGFTNWLTYSVAIGNTKFLYLNLNVAPDTAIQAWNNTSPTSTVFSLGTYGDVNGSGNSHIAYLFATCPGVSKVGSYTGTGTTLNIDCGFTNGARFVLIKRTDSTGDWYVWDTARGIISGNDSYLLLNSTAAEVTNTDYIDPLSSGFQISSTAPAAINASGGSYIYLSVA